LTFNDQGLDNGEVTVEDVTTDNGTGDGTGEATVVVTYTNDDGDEIVAGLADANQSDNTDLSVTIENATGFPGEHTAWLFADSTVSGKSVGDNASDITGSDLANGSAIVADADAEVTGVTQYQGQTLFQNVTDNFASGESLELRSVDTDTSGDQIGGLEQALTTQGSSGAEFVTFDTADLDSGVYT
ncbi:hypothetical protein DJ84_24075, partial [Halorubrum ezzemoulense]